MNQPFDIQHVIYKSDCLIELNLSKNNLFNGDEIFKVRNIVI